MFNTVVTRIKEVSTEVLDGFTEDVMYLLGNYINSEDTKIFTKDLAKIAFWAPIYFIVLAPAATIAVFLKWLVLLIAKALKGPNVSVPTTTSLVIFMAGVVWWVSIVVSLFNWMSFLTFSAIMSVVASIYAIREKIKVKE